MNMPATTVEGNAPPEAILEAALDEFADRGFAGARIDEIARRAGVNKAGLYYHVGNKETLYLLSLRHLFSPLAVAMAGPLPTGDPLARLTAHIEGFAAGVLSDRRFAPVMLRELAGHGAHLPKEILSVMVGSLKRLAGILEEGVAAGLFRPTPAPLVHFMLIGSLTLTVVTGPIRSRAGTEGMVAPEQVTLPPSGEIAGRLVDMVLNGLLAPQGKS